MHVVQGSFPQLAAAATFGTCYGGLWRGILLQRRRCSRHWLRIALADPSVATLIGVVGAIFVEWEQGQLRHPARSRHRWRRAIQFGVSAERKGNTMHIVGLLASIVVAACGLLATVVAFKSIPDIKHYRRIRSM